MKIQKHNEPWSHLIVDDFLNQDDFINLQGNWETIFKTQQGRIEYHWNNLPSLDCLDGRIINCSKIIWDKYYKELCGDKDESHLADKIIYEWLETPPNSNDYPSIHTDSGMKLMSVIYYVSKNGKGTTLRKFNEETKKAEVHHTLEWIPNRALVFVRKNWSVGGTWHNIVNDTSYNRQTLNLSICRNKHDEYVDFYG